MINIYDSLYTDKIITALNYPKPNQTLCYQEQKSMIKTEVEIHNARALKLQPTLETMGFHLAYNDQLATVIHQNSLSTLPLEAGRITLSNQYAYHLLLSVVIRSSDCLQTPSSNAPVQYRPVANFVHSDWGPSRLKRLGRSQDSIINYSGTSPNDIQRFINLHSNCYIYNIWLPLNLVLNNALAVCDITSIKARDCYEVNFKSIKKESKENQLKDAPVLSTKPNANHKWYYYPMMQPGEYLVFYQACVSKPFDVSVMHSNIELPIRSPPRRSMELRFLVA